MNIFSRLFHKKPLCGIHSVGEFQAAVERERHRSDRSGDRFSVVVFKADAPLAVEKDSCTLQNALKRRIRGMDTVGWFDDKRIGVLLPDTHPEKACEFARSAFQHLVGLPPPPVD